MKDPVYRDYQESPLRRYYIGQNPRSSPLGHDILFEWRFRHELVYGTHGSRSMIYDDGLGPVMSVGRILDLRLLNHK